MYIDIDYFIINEKKLIIILIKRDPLQLLKKHIVVTCNYVVHKYGVQKLQLWKNVYDACLALLTIEGNFLLDKNSFCFDDRQKLLTLYWNTSIYFCGLFSSERKTLLEYEKKDYFLAPGDTCLLLIAMCEIQIITVLLFGGLSYHFFV